MSTVAIIGLGKLGTAIHERLKSEYELIGIDKSADYSQVKNADVVIIAVKPQSFAELAGALKKYIGEQEVVSVMAGITTSRIAKDLGTGLVTRTMPSLALASGQSLTAAYSVSTNNSPAKELLNFWGETIWLQAEADFAAFTALAGSGPAYFLELVVQLQVQAERLGFDQNTAQKIANQTLQASVAILGDGLASDKLRAIASKAGVTEAGLAVLQKNHFGELIADTINAATKRSEELSK